MDQKYVLGIEFGSTRIKAVLTDEASNVVAQGGHEWENTLVDGLWSYSLDEVFAGLQDSYAKLVQSFGKPIENLEAIGISAMMHGYLAFDENENLLAPFRTWRNTNTGKAAAELSELFRFNVPMRWSISHFYQAILNGESHVGQVVRLNTLAGYVHYKLTGRWVLGIGDASGMFPVKGREYDASMLEKCNALFATKGISRKVETMLPEILLAGEDAGRLSEEGARLLDPSGVLKAGAVLCPPEGDMGTGMVATNSVAPRTANVSLGTSANLTVILEKNLENYYPELDLIDTPDGHPAALVHTNTCTSVINEWVALFNEVVELCGGSIPRWKLFDLLYERALESDANVGNVIAYNFLAGEPIAKVDEGRPMVAHRPDGEFSLANFMQAQLYSAVCVLSLGLDILKRENVGIDTVYGHGGFFKTKFVGQNVMSAAADAPVTVMQNAGEGGAWGIALLALFTAQGGGDLSAFLDRIFANAEKVTVSASDEERKKYAAFLANYKNGLAGSRALSEF